MSLANSSELSSGKRKKAIRSTVDGLVSVLKVLKAGTSEACPPAATVAELLIMVCEAFKTSCDNLEAIEELRSHIYDLQNALSALSAGAKNPLSPALSDFVTRFESEVRTITADIEKASKRSRFKQLLSAKDTSEKVTGCVKRLSQCVNSLLIGITADSNRKTTVIHENVEDLRRDVGDISVMIDTQNNAVPGLRRVAEARFDYYKSGRSACTKDTRLEALSTIYHWLVPDDPNFEELPPPLMETSGDKPTFWINGVAGSGKSTIAQTIAQWCMDQDILAASFFCARDGNRSNVQLIIPTIAYQLSSHSPAFRAALAAAIEADTDIHVAYATHQLRKLIVEPLKAVTEPLTKFVVIVDALDECKDDAAVSVILTALSAHVDDLAPLKFIITSRPETHIVSGFKLKPLSQTTEQLVLSAVPEEMTTRDIGIYFREEFNTVRESRGLDPAWPVDRDVEVLTEKSHGLFIYAATAAKFVCGDDIEDPVEQLKILLLQIGGSPSSESVPRPTQESHFRELDNLYLQVLASAFPDMNALKKHFLGALALAPDRVSLHTIAVMFGANAHVLSTFLSRLQSIILPSASHDEPLRLSHLSFAEFIVDPARCINTRYLVDRCMQHAVMAKGCLKILIENLLFNICKVEDTSLLNEEVPDLESRIFKHIPPHLQYACRHWAYHTTNAEVDEELLDLVKQFSERKLLDWLSALSILGSMDITVDALQTSRRALEVSMRTDE
ncbi:hypothetical protein C8Q76DRAFT_668942 [Earliella scabrosa]|nr:hypothetical protein C8Q76DRAFT_668942 [Earliella scabrosa]